ncbi:TPA: P27 family phage terminase small subunit [Campylobacter jejuni]|nr:P27 family phage terminase small subunit [Campylobacter coli]HED4997209.1 P27 family phage terminase small subunit [Campylobacter jejuni]HEF1467308.1 P27 family phage terminase small subunit [Campylobacter jejuni]HEF3510959.1 P27 family phage terminase small subunit [Campylobacter jejuni]HEF3642425.1 P27 family phage terminase small subunit [Campylobacter jejuni]
MQKEFLNIDEVLQILNINSKIYLSRYLKKNGIKVLKGKAKPYPKDEILRLAKKRQDENHYNSKQNEVILYIDENSIKEKPKANKTEQIQTQDDFKPLNLETIEQELIQKTIKDLENLGIYDPLENDIIKTYVKNLIFLECTSKEMEKKGFTTSTDKGTPIVTPELIAFNSLTKNVIGLAKVLGIGSPNRARLNLKDKKEKSAFDVLLEDES